jgi:hypothetical protein
MNLCEFRKSAKIALRQVEEDTKEHYAKKAYQWAKGTGLKGKLLE